MRKIILFTMSALLSAAAFAQSLYPERGLYRLVSIESQGRTLSDLPTTTYRSCSSDKVLILWLQPSQDNAFTQFIWRYEAAPNPDDPFCVKLKDVDSESFIVTWFNTSRGFYDFPPGVWINETWKKAKGDDFLTRYSAVATNHKKKEKLLGSWKLVAMQALDLQGQPTIPGKDTYKIYGEKDCISFMGSLYNVEQGGRSYLRPFQWKSDNEFVEASVEHKVAFESPSKMTLEYMDSKSGRILETWIRHDIPEPLSSLLSNFKE